MTSANRSDEPIVIDDAAARERLGGIADAFLAHDRVIQRRCEDSVVRREHVIRRSRGMAPSSLRLPVAARRPLVAAGAELKSTFCVVVGDKAHLSPHLGDLEAVAARLAFRADLALYLDVLGVRPELVAHDLHEGYAATRWALEQEVELLGVQHHHAHAASCLAEHGRREPALAVVLDGSGWGPDGTFWGGEVLRCDLDGYERVAHLEAVPLPGGDAAIRQPWRSAAAYLERGGRPVPFARWPLVRQSLAINAPRSSGAGRLFDAAAALLGVREHVTYEGQAAIELEDLAGQVEADAYPCRMSGGVLRGADLIARVHDDLAEGRARREIAAAFHEGVAAAFAQAVTAAAEPDERSVLLTGGTMQNLRLRASLERRLAASGFEVLTHRTIPPNDGGISFGQAAIAARRTACA
ncbi:MAG: carbamoyltransferase HypF [Actinobacteria bacterium]|nr:carbamoyltransferase HypF [Actinomycetota bacterium]